jgi:hypothetical protein
VKPIAPLLVLCVTVPAVAIAAIGVHPSDRDTARRTSHDVRGGVGGPVRAQRQPVTAVAFLRQTIRTLAANDYEHAWTELDPRQQRSVPRAAYVRCESASPIPGRLDRITALEARVEPVAIPGADAHTERSVAVTFRLEFAPRPGHRPVVVRVRAHALRTGARWAWMLPTHRFALHTSGRCGMSPVSPDPSL